MTNLSSKIDRLAEIKEQIASLKTEADSIEAQIIEAADKSIENTKYKTVTVSTESSKCTATTAYKISIVYEALLPFALGNGYKDIIQSKSSVELTAKGKELITAILSGSYIDATPDDVINNITESETKRKLIAKKCKGKSFAKDVEALIALGFDEETAKDGAYMLSEAVNMQKIKSYLLIDNRQLKEFSEAVKAAFILDATTKISIERG